MFKYTDIPQYNFPISRFSIAEANSTEGLMNTLTISRLSREDGGDYNCIASNKHGSASLSVNFAVFGELRVLQRSEVRSELQSDNHLVTIYH